MSHPPPATPATEHEPVELTLLMPCLDEAETLAVCIRKAHSFLGAAGVDGEVLVADNGSHDGSVEIAEREGARVVAVTAKGYGSALLGGIAAAKGRFVIMGDADDSYDFSRLAPFLDRLRDGADLVMGNRYRGGIAPRAMPFLHRYLGNPVLSLLGRLFFSVRIGDFHCGLRGFVRHRIRALELRATGMEFASEMVVRSALAGYRIEEVPTTLKRDGRSRAPLLRTWRDGWRHLRFLLIYSPRWLFLYPGLVLLLAGIVGAAVLFPGLVRVGGVGFDIHTFLVACTSILLGLQSLGFSIVARRYAAHRGFLPATGAQTSRLEAFTLERLLVAALVLALGGSGGVLWCVKAWAATGFGPLEYSVLLRVLVLSLTTLAAGLQLAFTAFLAGILDVPTRG